MKRSAHKPDHHTTTSTVKHTEPIKSSVTKYEPTTHSIVSNEPT